MEVGSTGGQRAIAQRHSAGKISEMKRFEDLTWRSVYVRHEPNIAFIRPIEPCECHFDRVKGKIALRYERCR